MKKVLLGSTALVAAGLLAGPAFAQLELSISGSVDVHAGFADEDEVAGGDSGRGYGFTTDTTLNFDANGTTDNGLEYGVRINLDDEFLSETVQTGTGPGETETVSEGFMEIDETWVFVSGSFGEVRFGETDPAASELRITVPTVGGSQADGDFQRYIHGNDGGGTGGFGTDFEYGGDDTKIVYIGEFADFTVGASFSPSDSGRLDNPAIIENDDNGELENIFSIGGNYQGEFQGVSVGVSAGYNTGDYEDTVPAGGLSDLSEWGVGGEVGFGQITVGGFWVSSTIDSVAGDIDNDRYGIGASFSTGPWGFAANALISEAEAVGVTVNEESVYGVGVEYSLADGLTPYADLVFFDLDPIGTAADNEGSVFIVGVTASF